MSTVTTEERKLATVLFADVVGFTAIASESDPETVARAVDAAFRQLTEIVLAHGGAVDKYIGDSMMAVFGVPIAHDDDAERAVAAALVIRDARTELGFSIGVNTGEVMVMGVGGGATTVIGDAVNVAARLEKAANRDEVLVGPLTASLTVQRIEYRDRPPMIVKGKAEAVEVHEAVRLRAGPVGARALAPVALVGREDEFGFLLSQWRRVRHLRRGATVLVTGDPGIGKTRLADEIFERIGEEATRVRTAYPSYGLVSGVHVAADLLQQLGVSGDAAIDVRVRSLTGDVDPSLRSLDAETLGREQLWAFGRLVERKAVERPLAIIIDDVHAAAAPSLDILRSIVGRLADVAVLVILLGRQDNAAWLSAFPLASTLRLGPLSERDSETLVRRWTIDHPLETQDHAHVVERAAGNPLFLRELVTLALTSDGERDRGLPPTLRSVLAARLDTLSANERAVLQALVVLSEPAHARDIAVVAGPNVATPDALTALGRHGLVRVLRDGRFAIAEPLFGDVAYEAQPWAARAESHERAARLATDPTSRARHLARAARHRPDDPDRRTAAAAALAEGAMALFADSRISDGVELMEEAIELGDRDPVHLLALAGRLAQSRQTDALAVLGLIGENADPEVLAECELIAANATASIDPEAGLARFDVAAARWAALGNTSKQGWTASNKAVSLFMMGRLREADRMLAQALEKFRAVNDRDGEVASLTFRALVRPDHPEVARWLTDGLAFADERNDRARRVNAVSSLSWHHYLRSRLGGLAAQQEARAWALEAAELAIELRIEDTAIQATGILADLNRLSGDWDEARRWVERGRDHRRGARPSGRLFLAVLDDALGHAPNTARSSSSSPEPGPQTTSSAEPSTLDSPASDPMSAIAQVVRDEACLLRGEWPPYPPDDRRSAAELGALGLLTGGVSTTLHRILLGDITGAATIAAATLQTARATRSSTVEVAAQALLAECAARLGANATIPEHHDIGGVAEALVHRAAAVIGREGAEYRLAELCDALRAPGLLLRDGGR